jgi:hypothetical protein
VSELSSRWTLAGPGSQRGHSREADFGTVRFEELDDKTTLVYIRPKIIAGTVCVSILIGGEDIAGGPFEVRVLPGKALRAFSLNAEAAAGVTRFDVSQEILSSLDLHDLSCQVFGPSSAPYTPQLELTDAGLTVTYRTVESGLHKVSANPAPFRFAR